ncbi:EF-hand domain-containing protein [Xanthomonas cerealis pv. cerealis]|uniref:EF-hand domain-containing protein n=1 Tax=Xanthomonas translucens group TaxID=3390202 RepID=UPI001E3F7087|nr:EF-hand domain-containing protein [Xanthomonas translucens]UKE69907.1 EF-hand domain-containing protein [Xanthomonas translucens pv. pistacia]
MPLLTGLVASGPAAAQQDPAPMLPQPVPMPAPTPAPPALPPLPAPPASSLPVPAAPASDAGAAAGARSFAALDLDRDGRIGRVEAAADPVLRETFDTFDADADGALSREEYAHYQPGLGDPAAQ